MVRVFAACGLACLLTVARAQTPGDNVAPVVVRDTTTPAFVFAWSASDTGAEQSGLRTITSTISCASVTADVDPFPLCDATGVVHMRATLGDTSHACQVCFHVADCAGNVTTVCAEYRPIPPNADVRAPALARLPGQPSGYFEWTASDGRAHDTGLDSIWMGSAVNMTLQYTAFALCDTLAQSTLSLFVINSRAAAHATVYARDCAGNIAHDTVSYTPPVNGVEEGGVAPTRTAIGPVFPNPARESAIVAIEIGDAGADRSIALSVIDPLGRVVARVLDAHLAAGRYRIPLPLDAMPTGLYRLVLTGAGAPLVHPLAVVR